MVTRWLPALADDTAAASVSRDQDENDGRTAHEGSWLGDIGWESVPSGSLRADACTRSGLGSVHRRALSPLSRRRRGRDPRDVAAHRRSGRGPRPHRSGPARCAVRSTRGSTTCTTPARKSRARSRHRQRTSGRSSRSSWRYRPRDQDAALGARRCRTTGREGRQADRRDDSRGFRQVLERGHRRPEDARQGEDRRPERIHERGAHRAGRLPSRPSKVCRRPSRRHVPRMSRHCSPRSRTRRTAKPSLAEAARDAGASPATIAGRVPARATEHVPRPDHIRHHLPEVVGIGDEPAVTTGNARSSEHRPEPPSRARRSRPRSRPRRRGDRDRPPPATRAA